MDTRYKALSEENIKQIRFLFPRAANKTQTIKYIETMYRLWISMDYYPHYILQKNGILTSDKMQYILNGESDDIFKNLKTLRLKNISANLIGARNKNYLWINHDYDCLFKNTDIIR